MIGVGFKIMARTPNHNPPPPPPPSPYPPKPLEIKPLVFGSVLVCPSVVHVCLNYIGLIHSKERLNIAAVVMNQDKIK